MIAVDLGQSGCRIDIDGKIFATNRGKLAGEEILKALEANFKNLAFSSDTVALSLTGLYGIVNETAPYLELCNRFFAAKEVAVIDDGLASLAGALKGQPGVALTLGGGVVAVGGNGQKLSHSDGLGSHFGDEGGGFWLGSRGLTRALATRDGRDHQTELLQTYEKEIAEFDNLESKNGTAASLLAISAAQKILEAKGEAAETIRQEGALRLAQTVISTWKKIGDLNQEFKLAICGGLSKNEAYRNLIYQNVLAQAPNAKLFEAVGDNLEGALWIANNLKEDIKPMLGWARI